MGKQDHKDVDIVEPQPSEAEIIDGLVEAEADERAHRFVDGAELIAELRRKADELQSEVVRRRA